MATEAAGDETGAAAGDIDQLADQVAVDPLQEVLEVEIEVVDAVAQFGGEVVAQVFRPQMIEIGAGLDEGAARLRHFLTVHGQKTVAMHGGRLAEAGAGQLGRPEQDVEIGDVLADEMMDLGGAVRPPEIVETQTGAVAEVLEAGHVADRCIQPDVEILAGRVGDFEAPVRRVAGDVPLLQAGGEPLVELVDHLRLDRPAGDPVLQHDLEIG